jgi:AraC-like DNA-binding protein
MIVACWRPIGHLHRVTAQIPFDFLATLLGEAPARAMLEGAALPADGSAIGHLDFWRLLRNNIDETGDERHALGPQTVPDGSFALLLAAMRLGHDLGDGLARLATASRIVWPDLPLTVRRGNDLRLCVPGTDAVPAQRRLYVEMVVVVLHTACCWMAGQKLAPRRLVAPRDDAPGNGALFALIGCPVVRRGSGMELVYPASAADLRIVADRFDLWPSLLFETYRQITAEPLAQASTSDRVLDLLWQAPLDQATLAAALGISVATLRRRLAEEGQSYRGLVGHVRQQQTLAALRAEMGLEDLAEGLGYSEARSLRRATRRWFGASPSALRRQMG